LSPTDGNLTENKNVDFNFSVKSLDASVSDCNLKINSNIDANHIHLGSILLTDTNYSIKYSLPSEADYNWNVTCYTATNSATSAIDKNISYHVNLVNLRVGLLGYWKSENGTTDSSGNSNTGSWTGTATYANGKFGQSFAFNGTDREVSVTMNNMPSQETFTVSVWAKANRLTMRNGNMFGWGHDWSADTFSLMIGGMDGYGDVLSNQLVLLNGYNGGWKGTGYFLNDLNWHHFLATANNTTLNVYVDGVRVPNALTVGGDAVMNSLVHIGHWPGGYYQSGQSGFPYLRYYDGNIDEAAMWNRVLTSTEIANLYNDGNGRQLN
jgi:hypothetical protein